jgi:Na+/H+ antiporter NhaC
MQIEAFACLPAALSMCSMTMLLSISTCSAPAPADEVVTVAERAAYAAAAAVVMCVVCALTTFVASLLPRHSLCCSPCA